MNLDKLLSDALKHAHDLKHAGARLHASIEAALIHREIQRKYGPPNWLPGKLIELLWTSETGETSSLGVFQEMVHRSGCGRRLRRVDSTPPAVEVEFVYGEHWVSPRAPVARTTSVHEIFELRERLDELMREVEQECPASST